VHVPTLWDIAQDGVYNAAQLPVRVMDRLCDAAALLAAEKVPAPAHQPGHAAC
jgi:hypothetical protein